jgi:phage repressor protein C with HTH and peptisase S24 domain
LKSQRAESTPFVRYDEESTLSIPVLVGLLRTVLDAGKPFWLEATGGSMWPFVRDGDVITISPLSDAPPRLGDVIAFTRPQTRELVVHRLVGKRDEFFLFRGDGASEETDLVSRGDILGHVTRVERNRRRISFGLGPERALIAVLSRWGILWPLLSSVWRLVRPVARRLGLWPGVEQATDE